MSDTPRTDERSIDMYNTYTGSPMYMVSSSFSRQIERELNAANERIKRLEEAFTELEQCNLTDENCANMDVATRRVRNFARRAKEAKP